MENEISEIRRVGRIEDLEKGEIYIAQFGENDEKILVCSGIVGGRYEFLEKGKQFGSNKDIEILGWQTPPGGIKFSYGGEVIINSLFRKLETYIPGHGGYKIKRDLVSVL